MVQCTISLLATVPTTLVHALNFFVAAPGTLVLLRAGDRHERVNGGQRVTALEDASVECLNRCAHSRGRVKRVVLTGGGRGMWCATMAGGAPPEVAGEWPYCIACGYCPGGHSGLAYMGCAA